MSFKPLENKFVIITATYNNEKLIGKNVEMSLNQEFDDLGIIVVDDCSTDDTIGVVSSLVGEKIEGNLWQGKVNGKDFVYKKNGVNIGTGLPNYRMATRDAIANPTAICGPIDGDDSLKDKYCTKEMYEAFEDKWLCWSQFISTKGVVGFSGKLNDSIPVRKQKWSTSHWRCYRKFLFDLVEDETLLKSNNEYYKCAWDFAMMFAMAEMAGPEKRKFLDKILYLYNDDTGANCHTLYSAVQSAESVEVRTRREYKQLDYKEVKEKYGI